MGCYRLPAGGCYLLPPCAPSLVLLHFAGRVDFAGRVVLPFAGKGVAGKGVLPFAGKGVLPFAGMFSITWVLPTEVQVHLFVFLLVRCCRNRAWQAASKRWSTFHKNRSHERVLAVLF